MTLRIALTSVYSWPEVRRGGERYLHELGAALVRAGHEVTIWTTAERPGTSQHLGVPVRYLSRRRLLKRRFGSLSDEVAFGAQTLGHLGRRNLDVWHALGTADAAASSALGRVRRTTSVYTDLGIPFRWFREQRPDRWLHRYVVENVDHYVCLSAAAASVLENDFGRMGVQVPGGVDLARFAPSDRSPTPVVLFSGALSEPRKRVSLLLEAAAILAREIPALSIWLSGPGDPSALIAGAPESARGVTKVLGLGDPEEQALRYARAWVTVLPSENEAFGLALLESLACGTPIVAVSDGGGPADLVRPGIGVVSSPDAKSLATACAEMLQLAHEPGTREACRENARGYDWSTSIVPQFENLYYGS